MLKGRYRWAATIHRVSSRSLCQGHSDKMLSEETPGDVHVVTMETAHVLLFIPASTTLDLLLELMA